MQLFSSAFLIAAVLLFINPAVVHACTSWMVFSDMTQNNTNILHKNRDSKLRDITVFLSPANSPRKWVALGSVGYTNSGMNSSGLACAMNSGERCIDPPSVKGKKDTPVMLRAILESCDTAAQAVEKLKELIKAGDYSHGDRGSIFFFTDTKEGYICETTAKTCSVQRYDNGFTVRANIWQNPGMYQMSRNTLKSYLNSSARAYIAISGLNKLIDTNKKIDMFGIFDLSRHYLMPKDSPDKRSLCQIYTNSSCSMEIDKTYPGILSTMYVTIGNPRHTVFLPIPVCAEEVLPSMSTLKWAPAVFKRMNELKLEAPVPQEWLNFEKESMAEYSKAKAEAQKLIKANKRTEAVNLINSTAEKIWKSAEKLLNI